MRFLKDETYVNLWRWIVSKTQGYRVVITFVAILIIVSLAIVAVSRSTWPDWTGLTGKTAWDFASLLIVPLALAIIAFFFNKRQKESELEIAEKERELDRKIAQDRVQETTLQNYLDKMTELLLPPNSLRESGEDSEVRSIARSRTLTVLRSLSGERKGSILHFLYEAKLIDGENTVINLIGANLSGVALVEAALFGTDLSGVALIEANLSFANLSKAILSEANLGGADLEGAKLDKANLVDWLCYGA
jgi:hypothetical protein